MQATAKLRRCEELVGKLKTAQLGELESICAELRDETLIKPEIINALAVDDIERAEVLFKYLESQPGKKERVFLSPVNTKFLNGSDEAAMWAAARINPHYLQKTKRDAFETCRISLIQKLRTLDQSHEFEVISSEKLASRSEQVFKLLDWIEQDKRANIPKIIINAYGTGQKDLVLRVEKMADPNDGGWREEAAIAAIESGDLEFAQWALANTGVSLDYLAKQSRRSIWLLKCNVKMIEWIIEWVFASETRIKKCLELALYKGNFDIVRVLYESSIKKSAGCYYRLDLTEWIALICGGRTGEIMMTSIIVCLEKPGMVPVTQLADLAEKIIGDPAELQRYAAKALTMFIMSGTPENLLWFARRFNITKENCWETLNGAVLGCNPGIMKCIVENFGILDEESRRRLYLSAIVSDKNLNTITLLYEIGVIPPNPKEILNTVLTNEYYPSALTDMLALEWFMETFQLKIDIELRLFRPGMSKNYLRWLLDQVSPPAGSALNHALALAVKTASFEAAEIIAEYCSRLTDNGKEIFWGLRVACGSQHAGLLVEEYEKIMRG